MGLVRHSGTLIQTPLLEVGWLAMPLDRLGDGFSGPICFWPDFLCSVSPLPVRSVRFPTHSRIAGISVGWSKKPRGSPWCTLQLFPTPPSLLHTSEALANQTTAPLL
jgi:hypothetical protein